MVTSAPYAIPYEQPLAISLTVNDLFDIASVWRTAIRFI